MTDATLDRILRDLQAAAGLGEKLAVIARHSEALLTPEAEEALRTLAGREPASLNGAAVHVDLIRACREQGVEDGGAGFADALVNLLLRDNSLERKGALLKAWADPLLSDEMLAGIKKLAKAEKNAQSANMLRWHVQLLQRCRTRGVDLAIAAQQATSGKASGSRKARRFDPKALVNELNSLTSAGNPATLPRQAEILETLLRPLSAAGAEEYSLTRADLMSRLAMTLTRLVNTGTLDPAAAAEISERADSLSQEADAIRKKRAN